MVLTNEGITRDLCPRRQRKNASMGSHADVTLLNVIIQEFSPDNSWARVNLEPDPVTSEIVSMWLPTDSRINAVVAQPANWPPLEGDVWELIGSGPPTIKAWCVNDGAGHLYFVTEPNIRNKTTPISTDQALAQYGSQLGMVYRVSS